jgi:putative FmdB family regulatory protein
MPTYEYDCLGCNKVFEIVKSMSDDGPEFCDACGSKLNRVWSVGGVTFKGSGWGRDGNND